ncbi:MAG: polyphenol oxidase family protein [Desulfovibrio sp.]|nr:polyphenol oxidase family protein [Desulfovibrio sp.]
MSVSYIPFVFPGLDSVRCIFQTRPGGVCQGEYGGGNISFSVGDDAALVTANREDMQVSLQARGLCQWAELLQVHGDAMDFEPAPVASNATTQKEGDGMATAEPGMGLLIKTADCQPVLLAHKSGKYVAALHAGWRGNRCDFPLSGVVRFCEHYDIKPQDVLAVRGPSLGPAKAEFVNFDKEWGPQYRPWFDENNRTMDLWGLTRHQLVQAGIPARNIFGLDLCTASNNDQFFSYRCARASGRQASIIWIKKA